MNAFNKEKKIELIRKLVNKYNITGYEIAKNTGITNAGVYRIIDGSSPNPHTANVNLIYDFVKSYDHSQPDHPDQNKNPGVQNAPHLDQYITEKIKTIVDDKTSIRFEKMQDDINNLNQNIRTIFEEILTVNRKIDKKDTIQNNRNNTG